VREIRNKRERERERGKEGGREIDRGTDNARVGYRALRVSAREERGERGRVRERRI
jgi:hypothetical protein